MQQQKTNIVILSKLLKEIKKEQSQLTFDEILHDPYDKTR